MKKTNYVKTMFPLQKSRETVKLRLFFLLVQHEALKLQPCKFKNSNWEEFVESNSKTFCTKVFLKYVTIEIKETSY